MKNNYVCQLSEKYQFLIKSKIKKNLNWQGIVDENKIKECIENAMSAKICDIDMIIDIVRFKKTGKIKGVKYTY